MPVKCSELTSTRYAEAVMEISELLTTPTFQFDPLSTLTHETAVRYHEAWMRRDLEGLMALYHPAVEYHDFFQNRTIDYAQLRDYLSASMPTGAREIQIYTDRLRIDGDTAFLQYRVTLNGSDALLSFHAIEALSVQNGLIVKVNEHAVLVRQAQMVHRSSQNTNSASRLGLSARQVGLLANDLLQYFEQSKPYLDSQLDLSKVAVATGYTRNQISFFLNQIRGQSFYAFINQLRIEDAIYQINTHGFTKPVETIANASGFNSLSTFYRCFKNKTGRSPKAYLQQPQETCISHDTDS